MKFLWMLYILSIFSWANIGNIATLIGGVKILRENSVIQANSGMALQQKDKIKTEKKSRVQVILKDDTVVTIGANSLFSFDKYRFTGDKQSEAKMRIERGFFRSVTGRIGKIAPERFKVKTLSATIGIRGTDFAAIVSQENERIICYRGGIEILFKEFTSAQSVEAGMMIDFTPPNASNRGKKRTKPKVQTISKTMHSNTNVLEEVRQQNSSQATPITLDALSDATQQEVFVEPLPPIDTPDIPIVTD